MKHQIIASLVTDPGKILQFPFLIFQMSLDFATKILQLMV